MKHLNSYTSFLNVQIFSTKSLLMSEDPTVEIFKEKVFSSAKAVSAGTSVLEEEMLFDLCFELLLKKKKITIYN